MSKNRLQPISQLVPALWLALVVLLSACGADNSSPGFTAAVQLSPTRVITGEATLSETASVIANSVTTAATGTISFEPEVTSTPVATVTPAIEEQATATAFPPTSTTMAQPTTAPTPVLSPILQPTTTPAPAGPLEPVDREVEIKLIRSAYDAINKHLFREMDTATLLNAALAEVSSVTGVKVPDHTFTKDQENNWNIFAQTFNGMLNEIKDFKYSRNQLAWRAVNEMALKVGDEHTYFMDPASYQSRQNLFSGDNRSIGFGVVIATQDNKAFVIRVVSGSPADKVGLKAGDQLIQYDDQKINDKNWTLIRKAAENEMHSFQIKRTGEDKLITVSITKQKYSLPTVEYRMINDHIGYIGIRDFFLNVGDEVDKAMTDLRKQGADSWIIDVRENPGGINVERAAGRFIPGGEIMGYTITRNNREPMKASNELKEGSNNGKPFSPVLPLVLLMDDVSASSSEILALTVRDFKLGPLIGIKTAGALGHTSAYPLGDGSAISVTVDEYESKGGERVNGTGVTPDIIIERTINDLVANRDPQLKAGVEHLDKVLAKK